MGKLRTIPLAVGRFVLALLLCVAVAVMLVSFSLQTVLERETYTAAAESEAFVSALHTEVLDHLESECLFYDLPYDTISAALPIDTVRSVARERIAQVYDTLCTGEKLPSVTVDSAPFKAALDSFFGTLPFEERPLDADASQTIATELAASVGLVMSIGISDKLVATAHPLFSDTSLLRRVGDADFWFLLMVIILAAVSLIPYKSDIRQRAYSTAGTLFVGSALVAVPMWLFVSLDLPAKLAIGKSALREYVHAVLYAILDRVSGIATIAFIISAVLLVAAVIWILVNTKENKAAS